MIGGTEGKRVAVVGAGLVGLATALYLQRDGHRVSLHDKGGPGEGASYGNAGIMAVGSILPVGMPGLAWKVPGMLRDPLGPLTVRWSYLLQIAPWLLRMLKHTGREEVTRISGAQASLCLPAIEHYQPLLEAAGATGLVVRSGALYVATTEAEWADFEFGIELRRRHGVEIELLGRDELRQMVPALMAGVAGAIFVPGAGHSLNPLAMSQALFALFQSQGGSYHHEEVVDFDLGADGPTHVVADDGRHATDAVVIAAGAYSRPLAKRLGATVPLDTERGYHVMLPDPGVDVRVPMLFSGLGFGVTPMAEGLRCGGTVEFAGVRAEPNYARADAILAKAKRILPGLRDTGADQWMGRRPSMPDSLPVISRSPRFSNVYLAFGHGHLGLTQAAVTGRMIADMMAGRPPAVDPAPFRADRFRGIRASVPLPGPKPARV